MTDPDTESERSPLILLGREIGSFTGWDQGDTSNFVFYNFVPSIAGLVEGHLSVDYEQGHFNIFDDNGIATWSKDIVEALKDVPRKP